jgi:hypothetical protein
MIKNLIPPVGRWVVYRKEDVISLQKNYFHNYPPRSKKLIRINLISKFFELKTLKCHLASPDSVSGKDWKALISEWNKDFV